MTRFLVVLVLFLSGCALTGDYKSHKCADVPRDSAWARSNCR